MVLTSEAEIRKLKVSLYLQLVNCTDEHMFTGKNSSNIQLLEILKESILQEFIDPPEHTDEVTATSQ